MVLVNGQPAQSIDVSDRGLHYGDGVFETMVVIDQHIRFLDTHLERLKKGCERLVLSMPDRDLLENEFERVKNSQSDTPFIIKFLLTRGSGGRGYAIPADSSTTRVISTHSFPDKVMQFWESGLRLHVCKQPLAINPGLAGIKHLNRLEQVLSSAERSGRPYDEGLMLSTAENVIEGTMSNIFWVKDGTYFTPDLTDCGIEGVIRSKVIDLLESMNTEVKTGNYLLEDVLKADKVFMTNSTMLVAQVMSLNDKQWLPDGELDQLRKRVAEIK